MRYHPLTTQHIQDGEESDEESESHRPHDNTSSALRIPTLLHPNRSASPSPLADDLTENLVESCPPSPSVATLVTSTHSDVEWTATTIHPRGHDRTIFTQPQKSTRLTPSFNDSLTLSQASTALSSPSSTTAFLHDLAGPETDRRRDVADHDPERNSEDPSDETQLVSSSSASAHTLSAEEIADEVAADTNVRRLKIAIGLCVVFFVVELTGGLVAGSLALLSDSFHLLSDCVSFGISLVAIHLSRKRSTKAKTFGYHRAEVIGALISVFLIWALTADLCVEAVGRITNPVPVKGNVMLVVAICGVCVNVVLGLALHHDHHGSGHSCGHDHSHGHARQHKNSQPHSDDAEDEPNCHRDEKEHEVCEGMEMMTTIDLDKDDDHCRNGDSKTHRKANINVRAATLHVLGDLLSSIGVLVASIVIIMGGPSIVDPICTFFFSALVIATTVGVAKESVQVLMESTPSRVDIIELVKDLKTIDGVVDVHAVHVWVLTPEKNAFSAHLVIRPPVKTTQDRKKIVSNPQTRVLRLAKITARRHGCGERFCTVQIETEGDGMECEEGRGWEADV